ncbi:MAG: hypothetical protein ACRD1X_22310 [Vicinamibacteria bacterium]
MAEKATIRTSSGREVEGKVVRENRYSPSGADMLGFAVTLGGSASAWPSSRTTVVTEDGDYVTGTKTR